MNQPEQKKNPTEGGPAGPLRVNNPNLWLIGILLIVMTGMMFLNQGPRRSVIDDEAFYLRQLQLNNVEEIVYLTDSETVDVLGKFRQAPPDEELAMGNWEVRKDKRGTEKQLEQHFRFQLDPRMSEQRKQELEELYEQNNVRKRNESKSDGSAMLVAMASIIIPLLLLLFIWNMFRRTRDQLMGGGSCPGSQKAQHNGMTTNRNRRPLTTWREWRASRQNWPRLSSSSRIPTSSHV